MSILQNNNKQQQQTTNQPKQQKKGKLVKQYYSVNEWMASSVNEKILKCSRKLWVLCAMLIFSVFLQCDMLSGENVYFFRIAFLSYLNCLKVYWKTWCGTTKNQVYLIQILSEQPLWRGFVCSTSAHKHFLTLYDAMNRSPV